MVGVDGSSPFAPTKFGRKNKHLAATPGALFLVAPKSGVPLRRLFGHPIDSRVGLRACAYLSLYKMHEVAPHGFCRRVQVQADHVGRLDLEVRVVGDHVGIEPMRTNAVLARNALRGREAQAQLRGAALLGERVLRVHRRSGRSGDPRVHQEPGERGRQVGSTRPVEMSGSHHECPRLCRRMVTGWWLP